MTRDQFIHFTSGVCVGWLGLTALVWSSDNVKTIIKEVVCEDTNNPLTFSETNLVNKMKEINLKFPHIVLAQSQLETGNYKSKIFKHNNNLFGMKEARSRVKVSTGTKNGHAHYATWIESLYDYAFMYCRYLSKINNEEEYYDYLGRVYAEDPLYVSKLKKLAENNEKYFIEDIGK